MSKREVPKINGDNLSAWQSLMKLHLRGLGDHAQSTITIEHVDPIGSLTVEDLKKKKEYNQAMLGLMISKVLTVQRKCGMLYTPPMEETRMF